MSNCAFCLQSICEPYLMNLNGNTWHCTCLKCSICGSKLEEKCFFVDQKYVCENDFYRAHGKKCLVCDQVIRRNEFYQKIGAFYYHADCFQCTVCQTVLKKGNNFIPTDKNAIICAAHMNDEQIMSGQKRKIDANQNRDHELWDVDYFEQPEKKNRSEASDNINEKIQMTINELSHQVDQQDTLVHSDEKPEIEVIEEIEPLESQQIESQPSSTNNANSSNEPNNTSLQAGGRRRGPRTTIKSHQLDRLKEVFAVTPKPPRSLREKLSMDTGLPMRVIQVWFQNRRSKERRIQQAQVNNSRRQWALRDNARRQFELESGSMMMNQNNHQVYLNGEGQPIIMPNDSQLQYLYAQPTDNMINAMPQPLPSNSQLQNNYNPYVPEHHLIPVNGSSQSVSYTPAQHMTADQQNLIYSQQATNGTFDSVPPLPPTQQQPSMLMMNQAHHSSMNNQPTASSH